MHRLKPPAFIKTTETYHQQNVPLEAGEDGAIMLQLHVVKLSRHLKKKKS